jgi:hypothetical protein
MKKLVGMIVIYLTFFVGCSNHENSITEPISDNFLTESNSNTNLQKYTDPTAEVSQVVNGTNGGTIVLSRNIITKDGRSITLDASLYFPQGSFNGIKTITMKANWFDGSIEFYPCMQFSKWLSLDLKYQGLQLTEMGYDFNDKVDFVYFSDYGNIYPLISKTASILFQQGTLKVNNGKINHFSRYGFIRKDGEN